MSVYGEEPDPREVASCAHWLVHRMAAKGLTGYAERTLVQDEWMIYGGPPEGVQTAIERGERDLTPWCPELGVIVRREAQRRP